jgi:hypothetical protein
MTAIKTDGRRIMGQGCKKIVPGKTGRLKAQFTDIDGNSYLVHRDASKEYKFIDINSYM